MHYKVLRKLIYISKYEYCVNFGKFTYYYKSIEKKGSTTLSLQILTLKSVFLELYFHMLKSLSLTLTSLIVLECNSW